VKIRSIRVFRVRFFFVRFVVKAKRNHEGHEGKHKVRKGNPCVPCAIQENSTQMRRILFHQCSKKTSETNDVAKAVW